MSLFAIADLHLSFGAEDKGMHIFKGWENHTERLYDNWNSTVTEDDFVVIAGDVSWGKSLDESLPDFEFIDKKLKGKKIILKGNHDYWWSTLAKMRRFLSDKGLSSIDFLHNNAYTVGNTAVCGTRGWLNTDSESDGCQSETKTLLRESLRLESSVKAGMSRFKPGGEIVAFLHYPPIYAHRENEYILEVLRKYAIKRVFSGHIHSSGIDAAFVGEKYGISFDMITSDSINFTPQKIL